VWGGEQGQESELSKQGTAAPRLLMVSCMTVEPVMPRTPHPHEPDQASLGLCWRLCRAGWLSGLATVPPDR
jgi:hypothetical protein